MTTARSEITLKFDELPQALLVENKKVEILLTDQNQVVFSTLINAKSWRKAEADATAFTEWGGAISGKLGQQTKNGFQVIDAGIKIFEKKVKEPKTEVTPLTPDVAPIL